MTHDQTFDDGGSSALGTLTAAAALAGLLAWSWQCVSRRHHERLGVAPERLQTWETEGGRPSEAGDITQPTMR